MTAADVLTREDVQLYTGPDPSRYKHYYSKNRFDATAALVEGYSIEALCGHVLVPHRDHSKLPLCPACQEIYESYPEKSGDSS